jgi:subtilisin family serine protease
MTRTILWGAALVCAVAIHSGSVVAQRGQIAINVVTNTPLTPLLLDDLATHGTVRATIPEINAVVLSAPRSELAVIQRLPYVQAANPDAERKGAPIDPIAANNFLGGINMWNLDAVNVTNPQPGVDRTISYDGTGVYVAVLDSGLLDSWRQYFPQERIAVEFARAFASPIDFSNAEPTNQWEHDQNSHGTHVTSTILGYSLGGTPINGVAPMATVIPVKVLGNNGSGFSSMIARGIVHAANLKISGALGGAPLVINLSLGGSALDAVEKSAIDYAIENGVIVVAAAGNEGEAGMSYPGAYAPVISVAASGWRGQWLPGADANPNNWWNADDVAEPTSATDFYIDNFSSRAKGTQDLDVAAPGSWVVGPYQLQSGQTSYFYLSGTSMASPHVAGIVALMTQKNPALTAALAEQILEDSAVRVDPGCAKVAVPGAIEEHCWNSDATGHGLATADAALAGMSDQSTPSSRRRR